MDSSLLNEDEVKYYQDNGYYLYHKQVFNTQEMSELTAIFEEHLAAKGGKRSDELDTPHFHDERLLKFLLNDKVLDLVEPILGPNIGLFSSHFICKEPFHGRATPWHEDSGYWNGRMDRMDKIVTVWLAIDRSWKENGCMKVIPGTQVNGSSEYEAVDGTANLFPSAIKKGQIDESKAVYFELSQGECSLHDARIIHGAEANTSEYRRCGYTMRYFSTEAKLIQNRNSDFKVWLARGKDIAGNPFILV